MNVLAILCHDKFHYVDAVASQIGVLCKNHFFASPNKLTHCNISMNKGTIDNINYITVIVVIWQEIHWD